MTVILRQEGQRFKVIFFTKLVHGWPGIYATLSQKGINAIEETLKAWVTSGRMLTGSLLQSRLDAAKLRTARLTCTGLIFWGRWL